ncbi:MAG: EscU/YscU/HrcU family type III secretion system export apparatus switch protein [Armatimonadia bacterium]
MDELKRYPPTPRRLARLRQAGVIPDTTALTGAAVLVGATLGLIFLGPQLLHLARLVLARDLQHEALVAHEPARLRSLLAWHLGLGALVITALGGAAAIVAALARGLQTGGAASGEGVGLMRKGLRRAKRGGAQWPGLMLGTVAVAGGGVVLAGLLGAWGRAESWQELWAWPALAQAWGRWLAVLVGMALLHLLWTRAAYMQQARLSHRELLDEQQETEGPGLTKRRARKRRSS